MLDVVSNFLFIIGKNTCLIVLPFFVESSYAFKVVLIFSVKMAFDKDCKLISDHAYVVNLVECCCLLFHWPVHLVQIVNLS